ncbi:MAG TPA: RHS repeat-associated core domain-containing protein [Thermoanaerobaculia bacterium]|nr:RHS repeat-associated core domain-containing protein [Thermoanaerobaculia bacterium]
MPMRYGCARVSFHLQVGMILALGLWIAPAAEAQNNCGTTALGDYYWSASGQVTKSNNCLGGSGFRCHAAETLGWSVEKTNPACNPNTGSCGVKIHATATVPGLRDMIIEEGSLFVSLTPWAEWYPCAGAGCTKDFTCGLAAFGGQINFDNLDTYIQRGITCGQAWSTNLSVKIRVCAGSACENANNNKVINIPAVDLAMALGCVAPPPYTCTEGSGGSSGAAGTSCPLCQPIGGEAGGGGAGGGGAGCSVPTGGGGPSCEPAWMGKSQLRYAAGGVGGDNLPGTTAWRTTLGRFWSHDFAERIVMDPNNSHVWLLTRHGAFREFSNLAAGGGLRLYQGRVPSDELRKLYFDTATSGWQLHSLDGRKDYFLSDGRWDKTTFAQDPGNPIQGTYNGSNQLITVSFPDGRSDSFTYHVGGKLASITEAAVAGSGTSSRTWSFTWSGDELTLAARPDGTSWQFLYDATRPGYLTRVDLVSGVQLRVMAAFEYQTGTNNVAKSWRGDPAFSGSNATEKVAYSYTNPSFPTQAIVTRTVSGTFDQATTYGIGRDSAGTKPKITSVQGSCPTCGLSPLTTFAYGGSNSLLPSSATDAKGTRADFTYNSDGRLLTKTEAANVPSLTRLTTYTYDANFPGLVTREEVPSTSGGSNKRRTDSAYDPTTGVMTSGTNDGFEGGSALASGFKTTAYTHNGSGEVLTIDPPGFGTADVASFTYSLSGRNGHIPDTRTDPLAGTTTFGYDGLNRRTSVTDPNGVETVTTYDSLNRVTEVRRKGAIPADDLVTTSTYTSFGDLFCRKLPRGNGVEYVYDTAGRLKEVVRGTAVATPTSTTCLDTAQPRERTVYQLDGAGHRIEESLERWTGSAWASDSKTAYDFTCHLDKVTQGAGSPSPSVTEYCYDANDNLEKAWDANHPKGSHANPTQQHAYDALDRLTSTVLGPGTASAATTTFTYDVQDHLASVTDAEGNQTTYTTSDRDLVTQQVSPVSGTTGYTWNEHGKLLTRTDARAMVATSTVDAAGRVTQETFGPAGSPDSTLTTTYGYGSTPAQFDVGRLTGITRNSQTVAYAYDRFGRMLQDGSLTHEYDANGNRTRTSYPGGVSAIYTYDSIDRQATLSYDAGSGAQPLVTGAGYKALGPLATLSLANGLSETRSFDARYFPDWIQAGSLLDWDYTLDANGNPTSIAGSVAGVAYSASFAYQDYLYHLTQGDGPWGSRAWTYDKAGNRLSFARTGEPTQSYTYSGAGNPKLSAVTPAPGWGTGSWSHSYDAAGNQISILESNDEGAVQTAFYDMAPDGRMKALRTDVGPSRTDFLYDGRGYLREANFTVSGSGDEILVNPVYSSEGVLMARTEAREWTGSTIGPDGEDQVSAQMSTDTTRVFYFAGRPVAQLTTGPELLYLSTDHLGTPVLSTDAAGAVVWAGGVEPFGAPWTAGLDNPDPDFSRSGGRRRVASPVLSTLSSEKVFLRYPGQWTSDAFRVTGLSQDVYYNLNRWYQPGTGRYAQADPIGLDGGMNLYAYAFSSPTKFADPLGLASFLCRRPLGNANPERGDTRRGPDIWGNPVYHQYVCVVNGTTVNCGGQTTDGPGFGRGRPTRPDEGDVFEPTRCRPINDDDTCNEECITRKIEQPRPYYGLAGPFTNCQEWATDVVSDCALECSYQDCANPLACAMNHLF